MSWFVNNLSNTNNGQDIWWGSPGGSLERFVIIIDIEDWGESIQFGKSVCMQILQ